MDSFITKLISDVTVKMSIKNLPLGNSTAAVMIPIEGDADVTKSSMKLYYDTDDIATDFDADSGVFAKAEALFAQDGFNGPIEVVTTQKGDVTVPVTAASVGNVDSTATGDGAEVTTGAVAETTTVPGIVKGISDYLWSGARYVVLPDDDDTATILAVGKYLYNNQHMILVASVKSIENLKLCTMKLLLGWQITIWAIQSSLLTKWKTNIRRHELLLMLRKTFHWIGCISI